MKPGLSKSSYLEGLRCPLSLWYAWHRRDIQPDDNHRRDEKRLQGDDIGALARRAFAGGVKVDDPVLALDACIATTQKLITDGAETIFEAAAIHPGDGSYAHSDVLCRVPGAADEWDLIEVKSSTKVKPQHIDDLAFQRHVFTGAGYKIRQCAVMLVDNNYVRRGAVDPAQLFRREDVTDRVLTAQAWVPQNVARITAALADTKTPPSQDVSLDCANPFDCPYKHAGHGIPLQSVFNIYSRKDAVAVARATGSILIGDIPPALVPATAKAVDIACDRSGREHADRPALQAFVERLQYPLYYLDYETIMGAVPFFDGVQPYRQIPFQFSLHVQDAPGGKLRHHEFLHQDRSDPRRAFVDALLKVCGDQGSVIVYNGEFEMGRNNELAADFPEHAAALTALNARVVDLYLPFKNRSLYHPAQQSSASIKSVLPAFTDLSYSDLAINNGEQAMNAYADYILGRPDGPDPQQLFASLRRYCERDTIAMVRLLAVVKEKALPSPPLQPVPGLA